VKSAWIAAWMAILCALAAAGLAAMHVANVADAAHDAGVARALGLVAQPWRALDAASGALLAWLPVGTRAARAAMGGSALLGATAAMLFVLTRRLLTECAEMPRVGPLVAAVATLCATLAPAWQLEGSVAGGSALGAGLALLPLALLSEADDEGARPPWRLAALALALASGHDLLGGACALAGCAALVVVGRNARQRLVVAWWSDWRAIVASAIAGLAPFVIAVARTRIAGGSMLDALTASWAGERGATVARLPWLFVRRELGTILGALAVGGAVLALLVARARALAAGMVVLAAVGLASAWVGAPLGPSRFGAPVLASMAAACALAGVGLQAIVRLVAEARLPLARASAAMVLVLELVAPVEGADESLQRGAARASGAPPSLDEPTAAWDDAAWGVLAPRTVVVLTDARLWRRALAARATGSLRGDIAVVPAFGYGALAGRALSRDAALVPLWRDLALGGAPGEDSLSSLATVRPVAMAFEPAWGPVLGKHLVPAGLFDRFETEPRGTSDRRRALDAFAPKRERLARAIVRDRELSDAAAYLLRERVLDVASSGDRDLVGHAVEDLHVFAPDDPVAAQVVGKLVAHPRP
jgi:hypothetical protein